MLRSFLTSIDKRGNKIPSQNRTGYLSSPPPRPQSGEEIPVASSIPQSIFLHKTRQYFMWPCGLLGKHQTISGRGGPWNISPFDAQAHTAIQLKQLKQLKQTSREMH